MGSSRRRNFTRPLFRNLAIYLDPGHCFCPNEKKRAMFLDIEPGTINLQGPNPWTSYDINWFHECIQFIDDEFELPFRVDKSARSFDQCSITSRSAVIQSERVIPYVGALFVIEYLMDPGFHQQPNGRQDRVPIGVPRLAGSQPCRPRPIMVLQITHDRVSHLPLLDTGHSLTLLSVNNSCRRLIQVKYFSIINVAVTLLACPVLLGLYRYRSVVGLPFRVAIKFCPGEDVCTPSQDDRLLNPAGVLSYRGQVGRCPELLGCHGAEVPGQVAARGPARAACQLKLEMTKIAAKGQVTPTLPSLLTAIIIFISSGSCLTPWLPLEPSLETPSHLTSHSESTPGSVYV
ncbi:hypothetical protein J6590_045900 [Homalodisca vitripennis]|nr:hypothetical protein J6590_045900 [Homalodisca vitripennis]